MNLGKYKAYAPPLASRRAGATFGCCITSYNSRTPFATRSISALDQTMPFDRIVVIDDASTDGSQNILQSLADRYSSLDIRFNTQNRGVSASRHRGIGLLGTGFITQLDGDDCFWPTKNREEAEVCFDDPQAIAFSPWLEDGGEKKVRTFHSGAYQGASAKVRDQLLEREYGIPRDMTFAAKLYFEAGGYDFRVSLYEDWDFKLRLALGSSSWRLSGSHFGTVYNRRRTGLSGVGDLEQTRALTYMFLNALLQTPAMADASRKYRSALKHNKNIVRDTVVTLLRRCDEGKLQPDVLKPLRSRQWAAELNERYLQQLKTLAETLMPDWAEPA